MHLGSQESTKQTQMAGSRGYIRGLDTYQSWRVSSHTMDVAEIPRQ